MFFTLISANICVTIIIIECSFELVVFAVASLLQYSVPGALPSNRTILVYYFSTIQRPRPLRAPSPPPPHSKASNGSSNGLELRKRIDFCGGALVCHGVVCYALHYWLLLSNYWPKCSSSFFLELCPPPCYRNYYIFCLRMCMYVVG